MFVRIHEHSNTCPETEIWLTRSDFLPVFKQKCYKLEVPDPKKPAKMVKASQCYCEKELCNSGASDASQIKVSGAIIACLLMTLMVKT